MRRRSLQSLIVVRSSRSSLRRRKELNGPELLQQVAGDFKELRYDDGTKTVWAPRPSPDLERSLDKILVRRRPWERRWVWPPDVGAGERWAHEGLNRFAAATEVVVVGKGPSLDKASWATKKPGEVRVCINESVLVVPEPDVLVFQDAPVGQRIAGRLPDKCEVLCPAIVRHLLPEASVRWMYRYGTWGDPSPDYATAPAALCVLSYLWGVRAVTLVGFDAFKDRSDPGAFAASVVAAGAPARARFDYTKVNAQVGQVVLDSRMKVSFAS